MILWWCGLSYCWIEFAVLWLVLFVYLCFVWVLWLCLCGYSVYRWFAGLLVCCVLLFWLVLVFTLHLLVLLCWLLVRLVTLDLVYGCDWFQCFGFSVGCVGSIV